jgi:hypothetical protein
MKYRDNMTPAELDRLMEEQNAFDALLTSAYEHDKNAQPFPDEWEDEMETLRRAALSRGQP